MMKYIIILLLSLNMSVSFAAIYMQKDNAGNIVYSDTPLPDSIKVEVPGVTTTSSSSEAAPPAEIPPPTTSVVAKAIPVTAEVAPVEKIERKPYRRFAIKSPQNQETIQNQPQIPVEIAIEPELQKGDSILLLLDGKPVGEPQASTKLQLGLVERGVHQVSAALIDEQKRVLKQTDPITIFVHRVTLNSPANPQRTSLAPKKRSIMDLFS